MTGKDKAIFDAAISALVGCGPLKVWSVIVTILGDMSVNRGDTVDGPVLSALTDRIGVRPEALRVAIHRLRRDGWIDSEKSGRTSLYRLTAFGFDQTEAVRGRIYAATPPVSKSWHMMVAPPGNRIDALPEFDAPDCIALSARTHLLPGPVPSDPSPYFATPVSLGDTPDWLHSLVVPDDVMQACEALLQALIAAEKAKAANSADVLEKTALRMLVLHCWRRLVLRLNFYADTFLPADWAGAQSRKKVAKLLTALPRPDAAELMTALRD